ncbi:amino acid ABC transporter permease [Pseudomonas mangiferae]|uniref:Amino acid ABC transporter permease n=1 Tax=Pseudomonas mangiferae TaxID=2593654 RepID=A0A553GZC9_9PSED|nr:amino acid ABC transporter permease [Pseudomonas mangiferae]TRX74840.1 amino acid ABC transporter permease [Pseudomonas mangiferae]
MSAVLDNLPIYVTGLAWTLLLTLIAGSVSLLAGTLLAAARISPVPLLRAGGALYVHVLRNTPITIVFFFAAFVLPQLGISLSYFTFAVIALSLYYTAFFCEAVRAGINAVSPGQAEAARAIGLGFGQTLCHVILPQALRSVVPPLINVLIALIKSTAVASAFGVAELLSNAEALANAESNAVLWVLGATCLFYLLLTVPAGLLASYLEAKLVFNS